MYDEVFSEVRWLSEMGSSDMSNHEPEAEPTSTALQNESGRLRVLTPRQRARLTETSSILYLG